MYPVEVSASSNIANILPLQAILSNYMNVEIKLPPSNGLGRSIRLIPPHEKGDIDSVRDMKLEGTNMPLSVFIQLFYPQPIRLHFYHFGIILIVQ